MYIQANLTPTSLSQYSRSHGPSCEVERPPAENSLEKEEQMGPSKHV